LEKLTFRLAQRQMSTSAAEVSRNSPGAE